jgi:hypothetical protein
MYSFLGSRRDHKVVRYKQKVTLSRAQIQERKKRSETETQRNGREENAKAPIKEGIMYSLDTFFDLELNSIKRKVDKILWLIINKGLKVKKTWLFK